MLGLRKEPKVLGGDGIGERDGSVFFKDRPFQSGGTDFLKSR